jgi:L-threonylcarbamoyladenylate synthase
LANFVEIHGETEGERVEAACAALGNGDLLVHPTTSVYGVGGLDRGADNSVARLKGRSGSVPILRLVYDVEQLLDLYPSVRWSPEAEVLASVFWPGPLTLILDDGSEPGLSARAEAHPVMRRLLARSGGGLGSTSLNLTGEPPARTLREARRVLEKMPECDRSLHFLEAGDLPGPPTSTVLSLREGDHRLLREGAIRREQIESLIDIPGPSEGEDRP